jgi:hypothetical protein
MKFYEGASWKGELENLLLPRLEKYEVVVVEEAEDLLHLQGIPTRDDLG